MPQTLWTIGHSTKPIDEFLALLKAHGIQQLIDVRTIPRSRHNPQYNNEALSKSLGDEDLSYKHMPKLGGLRKPKKDSINTGWRNESFRGYADYMQTDGFQRALEELITYGTGKKTAIMCAEALPWRCHRSLIADALTIRGWEVRHIMSETKADRHKLASFAAVENGELRYPGPNSRSLFP
jgi:uncharacterized protein (DUF488 family)